MKKHISNLFLFMLIGINIGAFTNEIGKTICLQPETVTTWNVLKILFILGIIIWIAYDAGKEYEKNKKTNN